MANVTRVQVLNNCEVPEGKFGHKLCFQWCRYVNGDSTLDYGYRFIWKDPKGNLMAHRGQARIPSLTVMNLLTQEAIDQGWGNYDGHVTVETEKHRIETLKELRA